jgi:hypothetical protein
MRELEQRQWVSVRLGEEAVTQGRIEPADDDGVEDVARIGDPEPAEVQRREPVEVIDLFAACDDERNRVGAEAVSDERESLPRLGIKPLRVIDGA